MDSGTDPCPTDNLADDCFSDGRCRRAEPRISVRWLFWAALEHPKFH